MGDTTTGKASVESIQIGVIGSPSTTSDIEVDILRDAAVRKLIGELAYFEFIQDGKPHYAIGQMSEVELSNSMLEDSTMRSLIRERGNSRSITYPKTFIKKCYLFISSEILHVGC